VTARLRTGGHTSNFQEEIVRATLLVLVVLLLGLLALCLVDVRLG